VCVGIANIYDGLTAQFEDARLSTVLANHYRNHTLDVISPPRQMDTRQRGAPTVARVAPNTVLRPPHWNGPAIPSAALAPLSWTVLDRSDNGLRLRAPAGLGQVLTVGTLLAVRRPRMSRSACRYSPIASSPPRCIASASRGTICIS
jgi:hypothetical protein